jgi:hypothetical protein
MDASDLTPEQARQILAAVEPMMDYTGRLTRRMQQLRWKSDDLLYVYAMRAHDGPHALRIIAHYLGPAQRRQLSHAEALLRPQLQRQQGNAQLGELAPDCGGSGECPPQAAALGRRRRRRSEYRRAANACGLYVVCMDKMNPETG